jgi:2'-5' RNA ligase
MPRLFLAIDLPDDVKSALILLTPAADALRPAKPDQLHLTLHFLGECDLGSVLAALKPVRAAAFALQLSGVGEFRQRGGAVILWAGVTMTDALRKLHAGLAAALQSTGYEPENRPYTPHITLARSRSKVPKSLTAEFLLRHAAWKSREFPVTEFRLMSSTLTPAGSIYCCEQIFPMRNDVQPRMKSALDV